MARPRNSIKKTTEKQSALLDAVKFIQLAQRENGAPYQTHCIMNGRTLTAFDGTLAAGVLIEEELQACPHTARLADALAKCGDNFAIVHLDADKLSIKADRFRVFVPCINYEVMTFVRPDAPCGFVTNELIAGLSAVAQLANEGATTVVAASILLRSRSCIATDTMVMLEYWHGIDMPTLIIPKACATALIKSGKQLKSFGFSETTATFYFEDNSWLRTQLFTQPWPNIDRILDVKSNPWPIPPDFFNGIRAVLPHAANSIVVCGQNLISSHTEQDIGAKYEAQGIPAGPSFNGKRMLLVEPFAKTMDIVGKANVSYFFGDKVRGAIVQVAPIVVAPRVGYDDIPF